jgi:glycosyltransferase involved in cell wall biosynthesis
VVPKEITQLHIIEGLSDIGGTARMLLALAQYARQKRTSLVFVCYRAVPLRDCFLKFGAEVVSIDTLSPFAITTAVIETARKYHADVICTHFTRPIVTGLIAAKVCRLPLVHHIHGSACGWSRRQRFIEGMFMRRADLIVCNSAHTRDSVGNCCGVAFERTTVLPCPVEERQTTREANVVRSALGWGDATIVVGHVGGMIGLRDQRTLLSAFASFNRRCPDSGLLLIGDGPLRRELEAFSGELGISGQVKFLGYKVEVGNFLRAMDIYVNPAYLEGFGIAVGEAMLARLPVVLANGGSHPELVVDGESGILYSPGDVGALLDVLEKLARNPASRFKLGESARSRALDIFSPAEIASRHVALLSDVIEETNRRRHKQQKVT